VVRYLRVKGPADTAGKANPYKLQWCRIAQSTIRDHEENSDVSAIRMLFLMISAALLVGIWLTGFRNVHWFLYVPVVALAFAGITGICPGYMVFRKLGFKGQGNRV
jgi:hypothetical protein